MSNLNDPWIPHMFLSKVANPVSPSVSGRTLDYFTDPMHMPRETTLKQMRTVFAMKKTVDLVDNVLYRLEAGMNI